jgi:signal transduction histidine kinase
MNHPDPCSLGGDVMPAQAATRPRILLVDDAPLNLMSLSKVLERDCEVCFASDGTQALAMARANPPDLILLDVVMPGLDGFATCRALQHDPRTKDVPIIFLTGLEDAGVEQKGLDHGAIDFLTKPINIAIARRRILNHLERDRLRRQVERQRDELERQVEERTRSLRVAKEEAVSAALLKDAILRNMSHELRTPMNGILGMLALAQANCPQGRVTDYLGKVETSARRLHATLSSLLDLAEVESGRAILHKAPFQPADVLARVTASCKPRAVAKGLTLSCTVSEALRSGRVYLADAARIEQILLALVDNAIKFSDHGDISVVAQSLAEGPAGAMLQVRVMDQGIGIAAKDLDKVFLAFEQVDASRARRFEGSGIGLALSRKLAKKMGGDLRAYSLEGEGSTFVLDVPLERAA